MPPLKLASIVRPAQGLNKKDPPDELAPEMAQVLENFDIQQAGAIKKRTGYADYGTPIADTTVSDMGRLRLTSGNITLARCGTKIYYSTDAGAGGSWSILQYNGADLALNDSTTRVSFAQYLADIYICTPYDGMYKWDGSEDDATKVGITRPTQAPTTANSTYRTLSNPDHLFFSREYAYLYRTTNGISYLGPSTGIIDLTPAGWDDDGNPDIWYLPEVTLPNDSGVSGLLGRALYRKVEGELNWVRINATGAPHIARTILDNVYRILQPRPNAFYPAGGDDLELNLGIDEAPDAQYLWVHEAGQQLMAAGDPTAGNEGLIYFSFSGLPSSWIPGVLNLKPPKAENQAIQGGLSDGGRSLIFGADSIWSVYGQPSDDPTTWSTEHTVPTVGTTSPKSFVASPFGIFFYGSDGVLWRLNGNDLTRISYPIEGYFFEGNDKICAAYIGDRRQIWFGVATASNANNSRIAIWDLSREQWTDYITIRATDILPLEGAGDPAGSSRIILFADGTDTIKKMALSGFQDGDSTIRSRYKSPRIALNIGSGRSIADQIRFDLEAGGGSITGAIYMNDANVGDFHISMCGSACRQWHRAYFDQSVVGSNLALEVCHTDNFAFTLHGWQLGFIERPVTEP